MAMGAGPAGLGFRAPGAIVVAVWVGGPIVNSVVDAKAKEKLHCWKVRIVCAVKAARGESSLDPGVPRAVTVGFSFHPGNHGGHTADLDNFIKPVLDAAAAGLFCRRDKHPEQVAKWDFDDSAFGPISMYRLPTPARREDEGACIVIASAG